MYFPKVKKVRMDTETFAHILKIWNSLPENMKESGTLLSFRERIKTWVCRYCSDYTLLNL